MAGTSATASGLTLIGGAADGIGGFTPGLNLTVSGAGGISGLPAGLNLTTGSSETTVTLYSDGTYDDTLETSDAVAANVLTAVDAGSAYADNTSGYTGWYLFGGATYYCDQLFIGIDTSSIPDGATVTSVTLTVTASAAAGTGSAIQVRICPSRAGQPAVTDWLTPAQFTACALVASAPYAEISGALTFTSEAGFPAAINKTGVTFFVLCTAGWAAGDTTTDDGFTQMALGGDATQANRPYLTITYTGS